MHEQSLLKDLLSKINQLSAIEDKPLIAVNIQLGALAHISAEHLREHFEWAVKGTPLQSVTVNIREISDINHPQAQEIILESLEFEAMDGD